jgi:hypothetical protein
VRIIETSSAALPLIRGVLRGLVAEPLKSKVFDGDNRKSMVLFQVKAFWWEIVERVLVF